MTGNSHLLTLPASIKNAAERLAREDGVSLDQWIAVAVAEKVGAVEAAADLLQRRGRNAQPEDMLTFLNKAGQEPPVPGDEVN
jgi:hypothetical protein